MSRNWIREKVDLTQYIPHKHIVFNPEINMNNKDYFRYASGRNDGTFIHSEELIHLCLESLITKTSYPLSKPPIQGCDVDIVYEVGMAHHCMVFGDLNINGNVISGQKESFKIPVKVRYYYG